MHRIAVPRVIDPQDLATSLATYHNITQAKDIFAIEMNLPELYKHYDPQTIRDIVVGKKNDKQLRGVCGLYSKNDNTPYTIKNYYFYQAWEDGIDSITLEYSPHLAAQHKHLSHISTPQKHQLAIEYAGFDTLPVIQEAKNIIKQCLSLDPGCIKFLHTVDSSEQNNLFYELLATYANQHNMICFGMGAHGVSSRIHSLTRGAYATYGSYDTATCPGQIHYQDILSAVQNEKT